MRFIRIKREISKHKTTGAELEKRFCYGLVGRLLLAEYSEAHQLVRLELHEYPLREGREYGTVFREAQWVRGNYLHLTTHDQDKRGAAKHYYSSKERTPH